MGGRLRALLAERAAELRGRPESEVRGEWGVGERGGGARATAECRQPQLRLRALLAERAAEEGAARE